MIQTFHPVLGHMSEITDGLRRILIAGVDHAARAERRASALNDAARDRVRPDDASGKATRP